MAANSGFWRGLAGPHPAMMDLGPLHNAHEREEMTYQPHHSEDVTLKTAAGSERTARPMDAEDGARLIGQEVLRFVKGEVDAEYLHAYVVGIIECYDGADTDRLDWIIQHGIPTIRDGRKVGPFFTREGLDRAMKELAAMEAETAAREDRKP